MTIRHPRKEAAPSLVSRVQDLLQAADDFLSLPQIQQQTGLSGPQVAASISHLRKFRVVDSVESNGCLFWFITGEDTRLREFRERVKEEPGSRRPRARKVALPSINSTNGEL
jgi:DNA-binding transcriptional regulator GbsR (MarR family)